MDLLTGQRTFCLGLSGLGSANQTTVTEVPFVDSAGNIMRCNYIRVAAGSDSAAGKNAVLVEVSGVAHLGDAVTDGLSALTSTPNTSGVCGFALLAGYLQTSENEWHGSSGQVASGVKLIITNGGTGKTHLAITYGNLYPLNHLRLEQGYDSGA